ncbi:polysaccharide pyruvyl transferase family protein [Streptococcus pluranimalium]|uniref:polysaccharide pyruvyl transferase family protein n=1 Tax=Streptococcus pluranimalium TaxID=82348 RepID=UPI003F6695CE
MNKGITKEKLKAAIDRPKLLTLTNTDQIEAIELLAEAFPEHQFQIATHTAVSKKLEVLGERENVFVYPATPAAIMDDLIKSCDLYLDINHGLNLSNLLEKVKNYQKTVISFEEIQATAFHGYEKQHVTSLSKPNDIVDIIKNELKSYQPKKVEGTKYALFRYSTDNIGDEIQSLAAKRFLPKVDYYLNRDYLNYFIPETHDDIKLIMNSWYTHHSENFPVVQPTVKPLLTSMYFADHTKSAFSSADNVAFFNEFGPVGARSTDTVSFMESIGVDTYFSGCVTLTLQSEPSIKKRDFILAVDVPKEALEKIQKESKYPVVNISVYATHKNLTNSQRFKLAQYYLYLYQSARSVVTMRIHTMMPCLALKTPVLMLLEPGFETSRFSGIAELANRMTVDAFLESDYDINNPLENPTSYLKLRRDMEKRCKDYTGYKNMKGFLNGKKVDQLLHDPELLQVLATGLHAGYQHIGVTK